MKPHMEHGLIFAEIITGLALLGTLVARDLWREDKLFFAYIALFTMATAALWVAGQKQSKGYAVAYVAVYALLLLVAAGAVREGWPVLLPALLGAPVVVLLCWGVKPWVLGAELVFALCLFWLAAAACLAGLSEPSEFGRVKLAGLGFFFISQAAVSLCYVAGPQTEAWSRRWTFAAGVAGVLAFAWMVLAFSGIGSEGARQADAELAVLEQQAVLEATAERRGL